MAAVSTYLSNVLLNEVLRNTGYTPAPNVYLALYTTNPTAADTGTEVTGGSYARQLVTWATPSSGTCLNNADINFPGMPGVTIAYLGVRDALTLGNLLIYGALSVAKPVNAGDTFTVKAGDLNAALS